MFVVRVYIQRDLDRAAVGYKYSLKLCVVSDQVMYLIAMAQVAHKTIRKLVSTVPVHMIT